MTDGTSAGWIEHGAGFSMTDGNVQDGSGKKTCISYKHGHLKKEFANFKKSDYNSL